MHPLVSISGFSGDDRKISFKQGNFRVVVKVENDIVYDQEIEFKTGADYTFTGDVFKNGLNR